MVTSGEDIMLENVRQELASREIAMKLYDRWVRRRQARPSLRVPENKHEYEALGLKNFENQLVRPREQHLQELREVGPKISGADKVALLVSLELPAIEISTVLHKMSAQLALDPGAPYFSKVNQDSNCGTGCGCGCAQMMELPYPERIAAHMQAKPYSIDPFNEANIPEKERDGVLIRDFLESYAALSSAITEQVNRRYFTMGEEFR
jgi:hypothetical protein